MSSAVDECLRTGSVFAGRYEILAELGTGTFGRVYKACQLSTRQEVAVKVLRFRADASSREDHAQIERFRREMRLCVELSHPNIVRLVDSGETEDGTLYAVFEFVPGSTLKHLLAEQGKLGMRETVHLMGQVLDALSSAHTRGVVHRDLKPENIMVTQTGVRRNAMVLDFGLGGFAPEAEGWGLPRITASQEMMGTPCYAAPEQLRGEPPTTRCDLYSWGLIFIECLTGELAVRGASVHEAVLKQLNDEPIPIPAEVADERLRKLLQVVTAKAVEKRDVTVEGLLRALSVVESGESFSESEGGEEERLSEGERRQVTVLSCRLTVSRPDGRRVDLEQLDELAHAQYALYAELAARGGGRVAGAFGDRAMIVFGYPQAREDDARRAARTALSIAGEVRRRGAHWESERGIRLEVRVGVHTGLVIARELRRPTAQGAFDLVGPTPQVATHLEEMAGAGEVIASADTQRLLRNDIEREPAGTCGLPEMGGAVPVFKLTAVRQTVPGAETIRPERETRLVGRAQQLAQLVEAWNRAQAGGGSTVLVTGEPGIGKSRLVRELRRQVPTEAWLALQCAAESQNSPLRPIVDLLSGREEPIAALLARHGMGSAENLLLFAELLSLPVDDLPSRVQLTPERQKELTLNALVTLLLRMAAEQPLVFAMEDIHWADPTTLELVGLLIDEIGAAALAGGADAPRLCVLLTARPQFAPTWSMERMSLVPLPHLVRTEVEEMVKASFVDDRSPLPKKVVDEVIVRSDGIPLFVEEVARVLVEPGADAAGGEEDVEIPASLRDLFMARLDGVCGSAKETAQIASVLGREFRYEVLRAVSNKPESLVRADLRELVTSSLTYQRRSARAESYLFKHALLRDTAYESMMRSTRQALHARVANTLRERFPDVERTQPEVVAHHFEHGAQLDGAAEYWRRAGALALRRGTYVEAIRHLEQGLSLVRVMPQTLEARRLEVALTEPLGTAFVATQGYASEAVEKTFGRAMALCQELGEDVSFRVLYGMWGVHFIRSERDTTAYLLERLRLHAERTGEPIAVCTAESGGGLRAFFGGDFAHARAELTKATRWYGDESILESVRQSGYDGRLYSHAYLAWVLAILGHTDLAVQTRDQMIALALESPSPYARALAWGFALNLAHDMGDADAAAELGARAIAHATEQKLPFFLATALPVCGWSLACRGQVAQGIEQIQTGLGLMNAIGIRSFYAYYLSMLAEARLKEGAADEGLKAVDEGIGLAQILLDRFYEAELHRLKGELELARGDRGAAEKAFRTAHEIAGRQGARLFELRAALGLARLLCDDGRKDDARTLLGAYRGSNDGMVGADVRRAQELLAEL